MSGRKKKGASADARTPELTAAPPPSHQPTPSPAPPPAPAPALPAIMEYQPLGEPGRWRVEHWELLLAELAGLRAESLPELHQVLRPNDRSWTIMRRLFGFAPLLVSLAGDPEAHRVWSRAELCERMGLKEDHLRAELEAVRCAWARHLATLPAAPERKFEPSGQVQLEVETDLEVLRRFDFPEAIFRVEGREQSENLTERAWFAGKVKEWEKLLLDRVGSRLARQALILEMRLKRDEVELLTKEQASPEWMRVEKRFGENERAYQKLLDSLYEKFPWFSESQTQVTATGAFTDLLQAVAEWESDGSNRKLDGVYTGLQIQVMLRQSQQRTSPQYRFGRVVYINESKAFLWEKQGKSQFSHWDLAKLDAGFRGAVEKYSEETGRPLPDLTAEGKDGEYDELHVPEGLTGDTTQTGMEGGGDE